MCDARIGMLQRADLACVDVDAVCGDDLGFEQAEFLYVGNDRHALLFTHVFHFESGL